MASKRIEIDEDLEELIPTFLKNLNADIDKLKAAIAGKKREEVAGLAHKIKGSAGSYGFDEVSALALKLEKLAKGGDDGGEDIVDAMNQELQDLEIVYVEVDE